MITLFIVCAGLGGALIVCQFLAGLLGFGGDHGDAGGHDVGHDFGHDFGHDVGHDAGGHDAGHAHGHGHDADQDGTTAWYFGMLGLRALAAALTFFGLAGMAAHYGGLADGHALLVALAGGAVALYAVGFMMRFLAGLKADGTVRIDRAIGQRGTVYLKIPAKKAGAGKVTLVLQNRTVEYQAVTSEDELPTGARVEVVAVVAPDTLEVVPAPTVPTESPAHV
jgi:hypothetical protein